MKEFHTYRNYKIVATDETPLGFPEGTWIGYRMPLGWQVFCSFGEQMISGMDISSPLQQTKEDAFERLKAVIDEDIDRMIAAEAGIHLRPLMRESTQSPPLEEVVEQRWRWPLIGSLPAEMLLDLHNALPSTSSMREEVKTFIRETSAKDAKAHWTRGVIKRDDDTLYFDHSSYERAVYRGKQETSQNESPRDLRRLQPLRRWSHEQVKQVFPRGPGACGALGAGAPRRIPIVMGCR